MNKLLFSITAILAALLTGCGSSGTLLTPSGEYVEASSLQPQERRQLQQMQDSLVHARAVQAIRNHDFILEADQLIFKSGKNANVSSLTNFVSLKDDRATVQVAPYAGGGPNGVGGVTLDGTPSDISVTTDKNGYTIVKMNVTGSVMSAVVTLTLFPSNDRGEVTVTSNFSSQRITLRGRIIPTELSNAYKGHSY